MRRSYFRCFGTAGADELLWDQDLKPHTVGEFSISVVQANSTLEDQAQVVSSPFATFIGVYDGHGGFDASRFINARLFHYFHRFCTEQKNVSADIIREAFVATEKEFLRLVQDSWPRTPKLASVGSCCLVGVIVGNVLHVANLGDSRAVLGSYLDLEEDEVVAERLTSDHNVAVEEVRKEVIELHPDESDIVVRVRGVWRIKGIIQVSRSIGDVYLKKPEYCNDPVLKQFISPVSPLQKAVVTAEPCVYTRKLTPHDLFLIFASDGFWEQLSDDDAVKIVFKSPRQGIAKRLVKAALEAAAKKMEISYKELKSIPKGTRRHLHDDMTVIVVYLDTHYLAPMAPSFESEKYISTNTPADIFSFSRCGSGSRLCPEP